MHSCCFHSVNRVNTLRSLSGHTDIIAAHSDHDAELTFQPSITGAEPSSPLALSRRLWIRPFLRWGHSDNSFHSASQSIPNSPNITSDVRLSPTFSAPVEFNPEIKQTLDLSVVNTFAVPVGVECAAFSRDGRYFAVGLFNEETHIFDMIGMSKR
jgi:hypothetical protein